MPKLGVLSVVKLSHVRARLLKDILFILRSCFCELIPTRLSEVCNNIFYTTSSVCSFF